ncbi:MAG: redoxin domain-containing protein [Rubrobacteraceae bacterium]
MRAISPRPLLLALALVLIVGAIAFVELRFNRAGPTETRAAEEQASEEPPNTDQQPATKPEEPEPESTGEKTVEAEQPAEAQAEAAAERVARKEAEFERAAEIVDPSGYINTDGISLEEFRGEKVVLLKFWTYSCYNCQNSQPHINRLHDEYADDGLQVIGIHTPEFEFEKDYANVATAVQQEGIEYPVVLDNGWSTWNAFNQRYWPAWYLIDTDGFIRYKHFGEGAYKETEKKIQELLAEGDPLLN